MKLAKVLTENSSPEEWEVIRRALACFVSQNFTNVYSLRQQKHATRLLVAMHKDIQESSQEIMNF